jgi:hypothetical protein
MVFLCNSTADAGFYTWFAGLSSPCSSCLVTRCCKKGGLVKSETSLEAEHVVARRVV